MGQGLSKGPAKTGKAAQAVLFLERIDSPEDSLVGYRPLSGRAVGDYGPPDMVFARFCCPWSARPL